MNNHHESGQVAQDRMQPGATGTSFWPREMTAPQIEATIRDAYRNIDARRTVENGQHVVQGTSGGFRVEMYVDLGTNTITTGYPL